MRILVTGAAGFVGSHLVLELCKLGHEVHALDALLDTTYPSLVKKRRWEVLKKTCNASFHNIDLRYHNLDKLIDSVDVIINEAGMPGLMLSWVDIELYSQCNFVALGRILESITRSKGKRLIQISTSSVYGLNAIGDEGQTLKPVSPYGVTKLSAEKLIEAYSFNHGLDYTILRYFSIFGPGQRNDMAYSIFIEKMLAGEEIGIFGDGTQSRTNTFVSDCVAGTVLAITGGRSGEIYNISGGEEVSVLEVIEFLSVELGKSPKLAFLEKRPGDQSKTIGSYAKAKSDFGYQPIVGIELGLSLQVRSYLNKSFF
jgi:nucleoside-diphosphate-sugar epimerase